MALVEFVVTGDGDATLTVRSNCSVETLARSLGEASALLKVLLETEGALDNVSDEFPENRHRAVMAVGMKVSYHLEMAKKMLRGQLAIASGKETASEYGFPEFDDGAPVEYSEL